MENITFLIGSIVIIALITIGVIFYFHRKDHPKKDRQTEKNAYLKNSLRVLKKFGLDYNYEVTSPAPITVKDKHADLDAVVIGYFGVIGIISLGYNGEIYGSRNEQNWLQVAPDESRHYFKNPITQSDEYVRILRQTLFNEGIKQVPVEVFVVFSAPKVNIALAKDVNYYTPKTLGKQLAKEKYGQDKKFNLESVKKAVHACIDK